MSSRNRISRQADVKTSDSVSWPAPRRRLASMLILLHLSAVVVSPWSTPPPSSDLSRTVARVFEPYLLTAYLNHGYRFFAPNPGPSHLIRYELAETDGEWDMTYRVFPHIDQHWPRLLYHRHFMMSETVFSVIGFPPPFSWSDEEQTTPEFNEYLAFRRERNQRGEPLMKSIGRHLQKIHKVDRVRLYLVEHAIPTPQELLEGLKLTDPRLFRETQLGEYSSADRWTWSEVYRESDPHISS